MHELNIELVGNWNLNLICKSNKVKIIDYEQSWESNNEDSTPLGVAYWQMTKIEDIGFDLPFMSNVRNPIIE